MMQKISKPVRTFFAVIAYAAVTNALAEDVESPTFETVAKPFFEQNCIQCHGPDDENGNLRVDRLAESDFESAARSARWGEILDAVNGHQMPPEDEPQPDPDELGRFADWVLAKLIAREQSEAATRFVLRRLNSEEYNNTIRDLLGIDLRPADEFPEDGVAGGFDNNGSALTVSPLHLELYYDAAVAVLDRAIDTRRQPRTIKWRFDPEENTRGEDQMRVARGDNRVLINPGNNVIEGDWTIIRRWDHDRWLGFREFRVPEEGEYIVRFRAHGRIPTREQVVEQVRPLISAHINEWYDGALRGAALEAEFDRQLQHFRTDRMYDYGPPRVQVTRSLAGTPDVIAEMDIDGTADMPGVYEVRTRFTTENAGIRFEYAYEIPMYADKNIFQYRPDFPRPAAAIDWVEIEGPVNETWPPQSHVNLFPERDRGLSRSEEAAYARQVLEALMPKAYRRPVSDAEVDARLDMFLAVRQSKDSFYEAIRVPLIAVLTSPNFLFLAEPVADGAQQHQLNSYEFASRLSYFLWSSMPDAVLFEAAADDEFRNSTALEAQVDRMLADSKSEAFVSNFAGQWLGLRDVGANPPVQNLYPRYDRHLALSVVRESEAFFREVLHNDLDIRNFIRSDFVMVNERLARFYGIEGVRGDEFQRIPLVATIPEAIVPRGGLLTQASILSLTSNGTRTSPVDRGVWVLRTMLGDDPGLPVSNVGEIAPSVPGIDKATVRERLEAHRTLPQCARCHNRIDPLGFALENYDASGSWRTREVFGDYGTALPSDPLIDASAQMPDGTKIIGIAGLQSALLERQDQFIRALTEKLLTYALGRTLSRSDQLTVESIVAQLDPEKPTLRDIVQTIVATPEFRIR